MPTTSPLSTLRHHAPRPSLRHLQGWWPLAALLAGPALAQTAPDAGQTLRELQRTPPPVARPAPTLSLPAETETGAADDVTRFTVREIAIEGQRAIAEPELQALLADLKLQPITLRELRAGVRRITTLYRERGFLLARAYVPPQQMADGRLTVRVIEGTLGTVALENRSFLSDAKLQAIAGAQLAAGEAVQADAVDRTLLLLGDLPGAGAVQGSLRPGSAVGSSDLLVQVAPGPRVQGGVSLDNHGNRYTGQHRLNADLAINDPAGLGDRVELRAAVSDEQLWYGRAAYELPVGRNGLRVGGMVQRSRYALGREFESLQATGTAESAGLSARYPLLRTLDASVWLSGNLEHRRLQDRSNTAAEPGRKSANVLTVGAQGTAENLLGRGAQLDWNLGATFGRLHIRSAQLQAADRAGPGTAGGYAKLQYGARLLQPLTPRTLLLLSVNGQQADGNLDSSEKLVLGGAYGVRAYPQGEGIGDSGAVVSAELWQQLVPQLQVGAFFDQGHLRLQAQPYLAGLSNSQTLRGYGVGARGTLSAVQWSTTLAWRDGRAAATAPDRTPRLWLALGWRFS